MKKNKKKIVADILGFMIASVIPLSILSIFYPQLTYVFLAMFIVAVVVFAWEKANK